MRDYVVQLRKKIEFTYTPIRVKGIGETAQPFLMWRNRQYATNRMDFNRAALQVEGEEMSAAELAKLQTNAPAGQFDALDNQSRMGAAKAENAADPALQVPAGQRARIRSRVRRASLRCFPIPSTCPSVADISRTSRATPDAI